MRIVPVRVGGVTLACAATVMWLVDLGWWESAAEPAKPWGDYAAENNTYWARDLRWSLIAAALVGLVLAVRGARRPSIAVAALGPVWLVGDALLDRANVGPAFAWAAIAVAVVASVAAIARPTLDPLPEAGRGQLVLAAFIAASTAPLAASMQSITDNQPSLAIGSGLTAALLVAGALGAAVAAGPALTTRRRTALTAVSVAAIAFVVVARIVEPWASGTPLGIVATAMTAVLLTSVHALRIEWPERGARRLLVVTPVLTVCYIGLGVVVLVLTAPVGELFTRIAGNPAVNSSDTDMVMSVLGFVVGAGFGLTYWVTDVQRSRPEPAADPVPVPAAATPSM